MKTMNRYLLDLTKYNINFNKIKTTISKYSIDTCFYLAAQVDVNIATINPYLTFESNIKGTYNLLEALRHHKSIKSIIVASATIIALL